MAQITTAELAAELGTDARTARKFLRADARAQGAPIVGKGARWSIERREVRSLKSRFAKWTEANEAARAARDAVEHPAPVEAPIDEVEDSPNDSLDALEGPSDAELTELED